MLERMNDFFNRRIDGYEEHMLNTIESAKEFYQFTARQLPTGDNISVLDLGCGTGLELGYYFEINPRAGITGIDLSEEMLKALKEKYADKDLTVIQGSYFEVPFEERCYDAVLSVESLHHFTMDEKTPLYIKVHQALKTGGDFLITDYFALTDEEESSLRQELLRLKAEQGICDNAFYHYDTPLTVEHETEALRIAGFSKIEVIGQWGATHTIRAYKQ